VSKPDIESIRGVNSGEIMNSLLDRGLVTIVGRAETPGRPLLYGTTAEFLRIFGLAALDELPKMKEIDDLIALQPQNLAAELGSAVIEDESPVLPEQEEIEQNSGEQHIAIDAEHESHEGNELS
jgi:segregation and condensation protein B